MSFESVSYFRNKNINQNSSIKIIVKTFTKLYNKKQFVVPIPIMKLNIASILVS